jgi:hypothetical protein
MQVLVYPNVQRLAHSHGPAQAVDYPEQCCRLLMKSPALVTAGRLPVEYDHYDFIYVPRGGGHVRRVRMLFQLFRSWVWLLWLLRLAKLAQSLRMLSFMGLASATGCRITAERTDLSSLPQVILWPAC